MRPGVEASRSTTGDTFQQTQGDAVDHERRAAVRDEGQRDTRDRHKTDIHGDIDRELDQPESCDASCQVKAELVWRPLPDMQRPYNKYR